VTATLARELRAAVRPVVGAEVRLAKAPELLPRRRSTAIPTGVADCPVDRCLFKEHRRCLVH
jgi:hypothetical protein